MRKLKLVKVVHPELVGSICIGGQENLEWRCPECGFGIDETWVSCPYCGSEIDSSDVNKKSRQFMKLLDSL